MAMGSGHEDAETLNTIFRAAHSIKGGSGTFGFSQLTDATHEMETLFDGLRKGKGRADANTARVLLDACDVFKAHIARLKGGDRSNDPAMDGIRAQLIGYRAGGLAPAAATAPAAAEEESFFAAAAAKEASPAFGLFEDLPEPVPAPAPEPAKPVEKFGFFRIRGRGAFGGRRPPAATAAAGEQSSIRCEHREDRPPS
jgi:two-component system chemotaxis sensor kinase CheA